MVRQALRVGELRAAAEVDARLDELPGLRERIAVAAEARAVEVRVSLMEAHRAVVGEREGAGRIAVSVCAAPRNRLEPGAREERGWKEVVPTGLLQSGDLAIDLDATALEGRRRLPRAEQCSVEVEAPERQPIKRRVEEGAVGLGKLEGTCAYKANTTCGALGPPDACAYDDELCCVF